ncbi:flavoprotein [Streptomyces sp. PSKA30]|uniref:flavoprotein n=1 Tax=Streptomyces sp. PSKA30 TaxID=2874597 RepID=UPI001CD10D07|nr:flavoprotein [Streptomyces sp. PSKA30]MBZ9645314.1 flavoprotein [Streptomyces sp. PSKA30]
MTSENPSTFGGRLLIGATGSAAVATLPMYVNALRTTFTGTVTVLMTHTAATFLPPHTVALFADRVVTGTTPDDWARENQATLAAEHDMMAVLPATANMLSATATGAVPNMLTATIAAADFPVVFFPVMTGAMWAKPAVQRNVDQLRLDGHHVVDPQWGQRYDVGLGEFVKAPMPPAPPQFIEVVREFMPKSGPVVV